ncbi:hypothetical protein [Streptomyces cucumeris]|uniref:hypothetical protein n=1 Tax=Streptomyces cucumeris TaxID=2962890 RepID=UPI0020C8C6F6|nr:hypothetical protein [Streptomyces sp. NEAU-Y11]MCP9209521.1 hypothetical protein [Streptomyces sp. NEAU-Y11]
MDCTFGSAPLAPLSPDAIWSLLEHLDRAHAGAPGEWATVTEYGIRAPGTNWPEDEVLLDGDTFSHEDQVERLERVRDCWPDAVLVQRTVRRGGWKEAER